jgi:hypothetical protein
LLCQAHTLDLLFNELAQKAKHQSYIPSFETFLRLALKAQNQCRMTIETLSNIKNPPVVFAKQANISGGHQQINNGVPAQASHAKEIKKAPNELLTELPNDAQKEQVKRCVFIWFIDKAVMATTNSGTAEFRNYAVLRCIVDRLLALLVQVAKRHVNFSSFSKKDRSIFSRLFSTFRGF